MFDKVVNRFLNNIFRPKAAVSTVPKKILYVSLPYIKDSFKIKNDLMNSLSDAYPYVDFRFIFKNPFTIGSLFRFKDTLPEFMRSCLVYKFTCPKCNLGTYIGCTKRLFKVRIDSHLGISHRTGCNLSNKENSPIRTHAAHCKYTVKYKDFEILSQAPTYHTLPFLESLYIKQLSPNLNSQTTSVPLHIT